LRRGFELAEVLDALHEVYAGLSFRVPGREEIQALREVLHHADHRQLRLLLDCWTGRIEQLRQELGRMSDDEYRQFVPTALRCAMVEPMALLLVAGKGSAFLDCSVEAGLALERHVVPLVGALLAANEQHCLPRLVPYVQGLAPKELRVLERTLTNRPDVPGPFRQAVRQALADLPAPKGILGAFREWIGLSSSDD
jgi:hypothetical protein